MKSHKAEPPAPLCYSRSSAPVRRVLWRVLCYVAVFGLAVVALIGGLQGLEYILDRTVEDAWERDYEACSVNMREIHSAILRYATDHAGRFPASFDELTGESYVEPGTLVCPSQSSNAVSTPSYVYLGGSLTQSSDDQSIVFYEPSTPHFRGGGSFICRKDGTLMGTGVAVGETVAGKTDHPSHDVKN